MNYSIFQYKVTFILFESIYEQGFGYTGESLPKSNLSWCNSTYVTVRPITTKYILPHNDETQSFISFAVRHLAGHWKRHGFDHSEALPFRKSAVFVFMGNINVVGIHLSYMGIFPINVPCDA